jgi:hypothetical protein
LTAEPAVFAVELFFEVETFFLTVELSFEVEC